MSKQKIVIDCRWVRGQNIDGIGRYTLQMVQALLARGNQEWLYTLLFANQQMLDWFAKQIGLERYANVDSQILGYPVLSGADFLHLGQDLQKTGADLVWLPNYMAWPFKNRSPVVMTVYDLIPFSLPELRHDLKWKIFFGTKLFAARIFKKAHSLIAISETTKTSLLDFAVQLEQKVQVVHCGVDERFFQEQPANQLLAIKQRYQLATDKQYVLCLGRQEIYKNIGQVLSVWDQLSPQFPGFELAIAGKRGNLGQGRQSANIKQIGYVAEEDLVGLYQGARLFVFPSLAEGFGLSLIHISEPTRPY